MVRRRHEIRFKMAKSTYRLRTLRVHTRMFRNLRSFHRSHLQVILLLRLLVEVCCARRRPRSGRRGAGAAGAAVSGHCGPWQAAWLQGKTLPKITTIFQRVSWFSVEGKLVREGRSGNVSPPLFAGSNFQMRPHRSHRVPRWLSHTPLSFCSMCLQ